jgi:hypothetical protein
LLFTKIKYFRKDLQIVDLDAKDKYSKPELNIPNETLNFRAIKRNKGFISQKIENSNNLFMKTIAFFVS